MLTIQIENPELEHYVQEQYQGDTQQLSQEFSDFLKKRRIQEDVHVSQKELEQGEALTLQEVFGALRDKYANP